MGHSATALEAKGHLAELQSRLRGRDARPWAAGHFGLRRRRRPLRSVSSDNFVIQDAMNLVRLGNALHLVRVVAP